MILLYDVERSWNRERLRFSVILFFFFNLAKLIFNKLVKISLKTVVLETLCEGIVFRSTYTHTHPHTHEHDSSLRTILYVNVLLLVPDMFILFLCNAGECPLRSFTIWAPYPLFSKFSFKNAITILAPLRTPRDSNPAEKVEATFKCMLTLYLYR